MSSEITNPGERKLVVVSGRAHPKLAEEIAQALDHDLLPTSAYTFANGETYVRFEGVGARCGRFRDSVAPGTHQRMAHGADHYDRCAQACIRSFHYRGVSFLPLRSSGQEAQGSRAHLCTSDFRTCTRPRVLTA